MSSARLLPSGPRRQLVLGAAALLLAGCGGGGDGAGPSAPTLEIRSDLVGEARGIFTVSFYFSAPVMLPTGTLPFSLTGGSVVAGSFTMVDDRTCTVRIRPNASAQGLIDLRVPVAAFRDLSGTVSNAVAYAFAQPYDTLPPLATLSFGGPTSVLGFITGAGTLTLGFSSVLDAALPALALQVSAGSLTAPVKTSAAGQPDVYTFTYTPPAATAGTVVFTLPAGSVARGGIPNDTDYWTFGLATR